MKSGIYLIFNRLNGKRYVGSSRNIYTRWDSHKRELRKNTHVNPKLQNSWNKYGPDNFIFKVLSFCPDEYLLRLEQWFIDTLKPEYNISMVAGRSHKGLKLSTSHVEKVMLTRELNGVNIATSKRMKGNKYSCGSKRSKEQIEHLHLKRREKVSRKIIKLSTGEIFNSIIDAAKETGVCKQAIHNACNKGHKCKGSYWQYQF